MVWIEAEGFRKCRNITQISLSVTKRVTMLSNHPNLSIAKPSKHSEILVFRGLFKYGA